MRRREFMAGLAAGAAAWPLAAHAQQRAVPVIGFLSPQSADDKNVTFPFFQGLKETGYVEGQNVAVEYRYAENQYDRLPALAADLVRRRGGDRSRRPRGSAGDESSDHDHTYRLQRWW